MDDSIKQAAFSEYVRRKKLNQIPRLTYTDLSDGKRLLITNVGGKVFVGSSKDNFQEFLYSYLYNSLGQEWLKEQKSVHPNKQSPVSKLYFQTKEEAESFEKAGNGHLQFLNLAYDLFLIDNQGVLEDGKDGDISRLKSPEQYQGKRYEVFMKANFIRAGFEINLLKFTDPAKKPLNPEWVVSHITTGKEFTVECKSRHRKGWQGQSGKKKPLAEIEMDVEGLVRDALKKPDHNKERLICIELNVPAFTETQNTDPDFIKKFMNSVANQVVVRARNTSKSAYIIFTNIDTHFAPNQFQGGNLHIASMAFNKPEPLVCKEVADLCELATSDAFYVPTEFNFQKDLERRFEKKQLGSTN